MSSSISSIGSYAATMAMMGTQRSSRPDSSKLASDLFSQIDSTGKGYIEQADLEAAFEKVTSSSGTSSADELFNSLDSDGDGKVTQDEMSSGLQSLMDTLDSQFESMRMSEAMGAMPPPPPPPAEDTGFTKDELQSQLDEIGSTDSKRSALISNIVENFDAADTDGDGKVTFKEAMAYDQSSTTTATSSDTATTSTSSSTSLTEAELMVQVMKLVEAYGLFGSQQDSSTLSAIA
jgi:Ca2+-binding EF-hand superfamily protein